MNNTFERFEQQGIKIDKSERLTQNLVAHWVLIVLLTK